MPKNTSSLYSPTGSGYDPAHSEVNEDHVYKPHYVPSEVGEAHYSYTSSDDGQQIRINSASPRLRSLRDDLEDISSSDGEGSSVNHQLRAATVVDDDREYRVEPLADVSTPGYAPSQPFDSASDSDNDEAYSKHVEESLCKISKVVTAPIALEPYEPTVVSNADRFYHPEERFELGIFGEDENTEVLGDGEDKLGGDFEGFDAGDQTKSQVDGIIADIFGESDAEEEEFEGFAENEVDKEDAVNEVDEQMEEIEHREAGSDDEHTETADNVNDDDADEEGGDDFVSDFDKIQEKRRELSRRTRRLGKGQEFLNDNDDVIRETILRMRQATEEDRELLASSRPATKKLMLLNIVSSLLKKADMKEALVENGMLAALTDWLAPLPGQSLPSVIIRETILQHLSEFTRLEPDNLRESGIGKAVMYLYKHPRETKANKRRAGHLINEWSRPIFNLTSDYRTLTKEERKQLDYEHLPKRRNIDGEEVSHRDINREMDGEQQGVLRPGDPGWVNRARVPQPSNKDYVIRPRWKMVSSGPRDDDEDDDEGGGVGGDEDGDARQRRRFVRSARKPSTGTSSRLETHIRSLSKASVVRKKNRFVRAVPMSIEGRKMAL